MTSQQLLKYLASPETLNSESLAKLESLIKEFPFFSIAHMLYLKNLRNINDARFNDALKLSAIYSVNRGKLKEILFTKSQVTKANEDEIPSTSKTTVHKQKSVNELIEKFIREEPRISKADEKDMSKINIPEQDESKIYEVATETLAKIYIKQGDKSKAIKIYTQLILKFPEKSSYFAAQIEKIKIEDINN